MYCEQEPWGKYQNSRTEFIGGSDARIVMGADGKSLERLWREKRGEVEPADLSGELVVQLGMITEGLNRRWYEKNSGRRVSRVQERAFHPNVSWMAATLDGMIDELGAVFESKFMLPWYFSEEGAAEKYMPQLQHNMLVTGLFTSVLSIITGGGKWVEITIPADPIYQAVLMEAEQAFWASVKSGEPPQQQWDAESPRPRIEAVRTVDMGDSNSWAEYAGLFCRTQSAHLEHERAKAELKAIMPEDAKIASGHGVRAKRSKAGAISFEALAAEVSHAAI